MLTTFFTHQTERAEREVLVESAEAALDKSVRQLADLAGNGMRKFVEDYSWWNEMVDFVADPDPIWAEDNLEDSLEFWEVSGLWVFDPSAKLVYQLTQGGTDGMQFPLTQKELWEACQANSFPHFFRSTPLGFVEFRGAPIQPGSDDDRDSLAKGWFLVGRAWDERLFNKIAPAGTQVSLQILPIAPQRSDDSIKTSLPLVNEFGNVIAYFEVTRDRDDILRWQESGIDETLIALIFAIGSVTLLLVLLGIWIVRPVRAIDRSLREISSAPLKDLAKSPGEFGEIARLITASFEHATQLRSETEQRRETETALRQSEETLQQTLSDRAQLGLNLHDHTIQTLYASGMSLVALENRSPELPPEARTTIQQVRQNLQNTIDQLRSYIGETETTISSNSVSESVITMISFLRNTSQVQIEAEIDDLPNDLLRAEQNIHLLQILREAVTNALRHAQAKSIKVFLQVMPGSVRLRVEDDGIGLPQKTPEAASQGLLNIHKRAELAAARLEIKTRPGGGTRIDLGFNPQ